ncbi:MAG: SH3 domain-containing protein [Proteobacteria bacterium]|nr:SH3 domain-containing protein [Pseudomonadota bacterium]
MVQATIPTGLLALTSPAEKLDAAHWPVRGDLAHIALAGRCFVPHYAVPMAHELGAATPLRATPDEAGKVLEELPAGARFDVLDMAGGWAWGIVASAGVSGLGGFVGYLPLAMLAPAA